MVGDILQPTHLLFVLVVALLVLGPKRLPEVGRTLGNGIRDFRSAINGESTERPDEIESQPWHSDPEPEKHEFAHEGETTPASHEFAHDAPGVSASATQTPAAAPVAAAPAPVVPASSAPTPPAAAPPAAAPPAAASTEPTHAEPARTSDTAASDTAATPDKHEFAYESSEAGENSAGPRS